MKKLQLPSTIALFVSLFVFVIEVFLLVLAASMERDGWSTQSLYAMFSILWLPGLAVLFAFFAVRINKLQPLFLALCFAALVSHAVYIVSIWPQ
jgi:hypothetical protein